MQVIEANSVLQKNRQGVFRAALAIKVTNTLGP